MNKFTYFVLAAVPAIYCSSCSDSREAAQERIADIQVLVRECIAENKDAKFEELVDEMHSQILPVLKDLVADLEDMSPRDKFEVWRTMQETDGIIIACREELERRFTAKKAEKEDEYSSYYYYPSEEILLLAVYGKVAKDLPVQTKLQLLDLAGEFVKFDLETSCSAEFSEWASEYYEKKWEEKQKKREEEAKKKAEEAMGGNNENSSSSYQPEKKDRY